jgi:Streptomyces sporulation and cell division protein, SsgA
MRHRIHLLTSAHVAAPEDIAGVCLPVVFDYYPADPLAVSLTFKSDDYGVTWVIARDLLRDGLAGTSGVGDVTAWAGKDDPHRYYLRVKSGPALTLFTFRTYEIETFLSQTYDSIPVGAELRAADLDAELDAMFGEAA